MTEKVRWEDPPAWRRGGKAPKWDIILEPLRKRPGKWARIEDCDTGAIANYQSSNLKRMKGDQWEFVSRKMPDGSGAVYARYVGETNGNGR